ncbi:hypothetical protein [Oerskovia turbata]
MKHYLYDRGIQASAAAGVIIAILAIVTDEYRPAWAALGAAWAIATTAAIYAAHRKAAD